MAKDYDGIKRTDKLISSGAFGLRVYCSLFTTKLLIYDLDNVNFTWWAKMYRVLCSVERTAL